MVGRAGNICKIFPYVRNGKYGKKCSLLPIYAVLGTLRRNRRHTFMEQHQKNDTSCHCDKEDMPVNA
jgi:hypothetical protein